MGNTETKNVLAFPEPSATQLKGDAVSPGPRYGHESVVVNNNKLLVWGGRLVEDGRWKVLSRCECFTMDLYSKQWIRINAGIDNKQDEPTPCVHARCAAINSMVYSFGGWYMTDEGKEARLNKVFSLDSDKMRWKKLEKKGNKPTARNSCGLSAAGEKLVMYGGLISHADRSKLPDGAQYKQDNASFGYANDCWEFCPHKVSWTPLETSGPSPPPRGGHSLTAVTKSRVVMYGGRNPDYLSDMHVLDCGGGAWTWSEVIRSEMWPEGRALHATCCVSPFLCVFMGGFVQGRPDGDAYIVDIGRGTAHRITLDDARSFHTACCRVASDGSALIFVFGGTRDSTGLVQSIISDLYVYSWDPRTPNTISICDNPTEWLLRGASSDQQSSLLEESTSTESSSQLVASNSTQLSGKNEKVREESVRKVDKVVTENDACDIGETTDELTSYDVKSAGGDKQLTGDVKQLKKRLREITEEKEDLSSQIHHLTEEKKMSDKRKEELIAELMSRNTQLADEVDRITQQCETLREGEDGEKKDLSTQLSSEIDNLTQNMAQLKAEREALMSKMQKISSDKDSADKEKEALSAHNRHLAAENEQLKKERKGLGRSGLPQSNTQNKGLMSQHKQVTFEVDECARRVIEESCRLHQLSDSIHREESSQLMDELQQSCNLQQTRLSDFEIKSCLGQSTTHWTGRYGCNSIIYRVERKSEGGMHYVMKAIINPYDVSDEDVAMEDAEIEDRFRAEYDLPCRPHPNIMRVLHHFCASVPPRGLPEWPPVGGQSSLFLVMQDYDCSLQSHCRKLHLRGSVDERFVLTVLLQLLKAIEHLAKHNILHRDLKMDNVLIKLEKNVTRAVICDFGCSYEAPESLTRSNARVLRDNASGNPAHYSPELCTLSRDPNIVCDVSKADVWAAGLMAYEMVTGKSATDILSYRQKQAQYTADILPQLNDTYSVPCCRLLQKLVSHSVEDRPSALQAVQLCCIVLYGPTIPSESGLKLTDAQHWLEQQVFGLKTKKDEELLGDPFYIKYLYLFSTHEVTHLINTFLVK